MPGGQPVSEVAELLRRQNLRRYEYDSRRIDLAGRLDIARYNEAAAPLSDILLEGDEEDDHDGTAFGGGAIRR